MERENWKSWRGALIPDSCMTTDELIAMENSGFTSEEENYLLRLMNANGGFVTATWLQEFTSLVKRSKVAA